ncbi:glycosyltransferase [Halomicrococcus sp. SG-WS-1]|uniref:glycosyltransferase n=1 Tax=Halomicrococcus sp. SG-WS-1 TaxID=3439057 RepID=UPI003F78F33A
MRALQLVASANDAFYRKQIEALEANDTACTTITPPGEHVREEVAGNRSVVDYLRFYPRVRAHVPDSYDLVHANYGLTAPFALAQTHLPVVLSLWGTDLFGKYGWVSKLCSRWCDAVVVMSQAMARELDQDCYVVPHGVDTDQFRPMPQEEAQAAVRWDPANRHVLYPYPPHREVKNYPRAERVVAAAREYLDADVPIEIQTVFDVPHERMPLYMNAADVLLVTSRWEGSPNAVKEALACNLPVVATDVGDVRERLSGVSPSYVCQSDAELVTGLVDVLSAPRPSNGRTAAKEVSLSRMGDRLQHVYETVLDTGG